MVIYYANYYVYIPTYYFSLHDPRFGARLFGVYTYVIAIMTYFQIFWDFGFTLSATRSCAENSENKQRLSEIVSAVLILKGGLFIVGIGTLPVISFLSDRTRYYFSNAIITAEFYINMEEIYETCVFNNGT